MFASIPPPVDYQASHCSGLEPWNELYEVSWKGLGPVKTKTTRIYFTNHINKNAKLTQSKHFKKWG